ncbi:related to pre-mRNA splicing factor U2AF large chain [Cephalotrichum gorgonifer]|uniref:Splicing factor U2AF subunit n=1 Tax=Cephalotrichum gorgonifer TaxID=2041049 RepID=A0AAE8MR36_9PEZI|nr:related to pre-mRNA splicing factor U2AF large chain [Cephalotrichum gorgonifer]
MNGGEGYRDGGRKRDYGSRSDRDDHRRDRDRDNRGGDRDSRRERRRSRSPTYRGSRRRDEDGDAYSSSRTNRDREREDRYSGRDRRDREWDRDRAGGRRDTRRDDDDRPPRRDRDAFDDRRRPQDRDDVFPRRDRRRSPSPPPKKREPTPDLTDVVPVNERKRRLTQWDIKPPGYENVTAEQAKLSGMFPLPGAPRQQAMDPTKLQAFMNQPTSQVNRDALTPTQSRQSKRLIVYNLPPSVTEDAVVSFFNLQLNGLNVIQGTDPCTLCQLSQDKLFALVEFKTAADTTVALALDGISMDPDNTMENNGTAESPKGLELKRPKDYIVPAVVDTPYEPGTVSNVVLDTPNKICIADLPTYLTDEQATELLVSFGELKAFTLVRDRDTQESRGIAFCEYVDPTVTDIAIQGLDGMELGEKRLKVRKASLGITQVSGIEMSVNAMSMLAGTTSVDSEESSVIQLLNMVTPEELMDNDDYEEICEDVQDECAKFGTIVELKVPRPAGGSRQSPGVGKIFVKYSTTESATKALRALAGRKFADRTVVTTYFPEANFDVGAW